MLDKDWQELFRDACVEIDVKKQWEIFNSSYHEAEKLCVPASNTVPGLKDLSNEAQLRAMRLHTLAYRRYGGNMIEVFKVSHSINDPEASKGLLDREKTIR